MMQRCAIYLDYNATAPMLDVASAAALLAMKRPLNPSSVHSYGREAKSILNKSRKSILKHTGAEGNELVFTATATEANNLVMQAFPNVECVFTSNIEHPSIMEAAKSYCQRYNKRHILVPCNEKGEVTADILAAVLRDNLAVGDGAEVSSGKFLVSIIAANNETGVINDVQSLAQVTYQHGGYFHSDAVQILGKQELDFNSINADMLTISSHKVGGGVGAAGILLKKGLELTPIIYGGGQERSIHAGTENIPAIAAFAAAVEYAVMNLEGYISHCQSLRDYFESELIKINPHIAITGKGAKRLPNTSSFAMVGKDNNSMLINLDMAGVCLSIGSACSSGKVKSSTVLQAMGLPADIINSTLRMSLGASTSRSDVERLLAVLWR